MQSDRVWRARSGQLLGNSYGSQRTVAFLWPVLLSSAVSFILKRVTWSKENCCENIVDIYEVTLKLGIDDIESELSIRL